MNLLCDWIDKNIEIKEISDTRLEASIFGEKREIVTKNFEKYGIAWLNLNCKEIEILLSKRQVEGLGSYLSALKACIIELFLRTLPDSRLGALLCKEFPFFAGAISFYRMWQPKDQRSLSAEEVMEQFNTKLHKEQKERENKNEFKKKLVALKSHCLKTSLWVDKALKEN